MSDDNYGLVQAAVSCASIIGSVVVGIVAPGPWAFLSLLFLIPIVASMLLIRRKLTHE